MTTLLHGERITKDEKLTKEFNEYYIYCGQEKWTQNDQDRNAHGFKWQKQNY